MTSEQERKCHAIIHTAAVAAGGGNLVPIPGAGVAVDTVALAGMVMSLAVVFGGRMEYAAAEAMAVQAFKQTILKAPLRYIAKELSKLIPGLGQIVAPAASIAIIEATGWAIAGQLDRESR